MLHNKDAELTSYHLLLTKAWDMQNPYQPPSESMGPAGLAEQRPDRPDRNWNSYAREMGAAAILASVAGAIAALLMANLDGSPIAVFGLPAFAWFATFVVLLGVIQASPASVRSTLTKSALLAIPAYVLYVPVCTVSSMMTTPFLGSEGYGPKPAGMILGSAIAFVLILLVIASLIRMGRPAVPTSKDREPE